MLLYYSCTKCQGLTQTRNLKPEHRHFLVPSERHRSKGALLCCPTSVGQQCALRGQRRTVLSGSAFFVAGAPYKGLTAPCAALRLSLFILFSPARNNDASSLRRLWDNWQGAKKFQSINACDSAQFFLEITKFLTIKRKSLILW